MSLTQEKVPPTDVGPVTLEERKFLADLELRRRELELKEQEAESQRAERERSRSKWQAVGGFLRATSPFLSALLIAAVGGYYTYLRDRQAEKSRDFAESQARELRKIELAHKFLPEVASTNAQIKQSALILISKLGFPDFAKELSATLPGAAQARAVLAASVAVAPPFPTNLQGLSFSWSNNRLSCVNTWSALSALGQLKQDFAAAGAVKVNQLSFWNPAASKDMRVLVAGGLAHELDRYFCAVLLATPALTNWHERVVLLQQLLLQPEKTVAEIGEAMDDLYSFVGEAREVSPLQSLTDLIYRDPRRANMSEAERARDPLWQAFLAYMGETSRQTNR